MVLFLTGERGAVVRELILGGVRSGKSRLAESRAAASGGEVVVIVTARPLDEEMALRIEGHRQRRPAGWQVVEEPIALARAVAESDRNGRFLIVDCLTLWMTNLLLDPDPERLSSERQALLVQLERTEADLVLVSNESGLGVTPAAALARHYCDEIGQLHQQLATLCERVTMTVAGLPLTIKG
jgi:adenosylcobinamide kinase/adenosylcobinamide-phosphate guanylyltransferase